MSFGKSKKIRKISKTDGLNSCYFRSSVKGPYRKALIQITERCNLHCAHCFVSAGDYGGTMSFEIFSNIVVPRLKKCKVIKVTLTGGEPFLHKDIIKIVRLLVTKNIKVGICTNGTLVTKDNIKTLTKIGNVHFNVSLDGFRAESHDRFRGKKDSFIKTTKTIRLLGTCGLLQGLLVTPNNFAKINEYAEICQFAIENKAKYVLMNPLSSMGRGVISKNNLRASDEMMRRIKEITFPFTKRIELVYIRFPNDNKLPLPSCKVGNIIYIFTQGDVTVCPYLVFAAKTRQSLYKPEEFIAGNILEDPDIDRKLNVYDFYGKYKLGNNLKCRNCSFSSKCGKGCPATVISSGHKLDDFDRELCPFAQPVF